jgi:hypothetical protein
MTVPDDDFKRGLMKIAADLAARGPVPYEAPTGPPPKIELSPEAIEAARRAIAAGKQFEFISGKLDFADNDDTTKPKP